MKYLLILAISFNLTFQSVAMAQADSCGLTTEEVDAINLSAGLTRMGLLSAPVTILQSPGLIKPVGDPASSDSVAMNNQVELYSAAEHVANEVANNDQSTVMATRCNDDASLEAAKEKGEFQLYGQACIIYQLVNRLTNMMTELDTIEKQLIEDKGVQNKAAAENAKREAEIQDKKTKMAQVNRDIKKAVDDIQKAKDELTKAKEEMAAAQKALDAANATTCPEDDDGSCASAKAAAIEAAQKALEAAKKKVDAAKEKLNKAVAKLVDYLVNKMGIEVLAVMSLLTGTITGETGGGDVSFKVGSSDYTLVDLGKVIGETTGTTHERARSFTDGEVNRGTDTFWYNLVRGADASEERGHTPSRGGNIGNDYVGFYSTTGKLGEEATETVTQTLNIFANMENGADYITTIALAALDFNEQVTPKQIAVLESQKTPQARMDEQGRKMEEKNELKSKLTTMITKTLCYLDKTLTAYKGFYKTAKEANPNLSPFYDFLNTFSTEELAKKAKEGYFSKVDHKAIQKKVECYAKGGNGTSCAATGSGSDSEGQVSTVYPRGCHWSGAVFGPSKPITAVCDSSNIGQVMQNDSGNSQTCVCQ